MLVGCGSSFDKGLLPLDLHSLIYYPYFTSGSVYVLFTFVLLFFFTFLPDIYFKIKNQLTSSATLCDAVLASEAATFSTPFTALGLVPEGCSSVHFPHLMGHDKARKMLNDGWKPTSYQALDIGLITKVIPNSKCTNENQDDYSKTLVTAAIHLAQVVT